MTEKKYGISMPRFLEPFTDENLPPNEDFEIKMGRIYKMRIRLYGSFQGKKFGKEDLSRENFDEVICVHDAIHSVALFLKERGKRRFALFSKVGFGFPFGVEYVKYYTQKYEFPLLITEITSHTTTEMCEKHWVHTGFKRWCSRMYKIRPARQVYRNFDLDGITQLVGMTRHQSIKRAKMNPKRIKDGMSQKTITIYRELPIYEMTEDEQRELLKEHGLRENPLTKTFGIHGCIMCPFRGEEYYEMLKKDFPKVFQQCERWRRAGCEKKGEDYYYFPESQLI